ncbi:hypothetical protein OQA88_12275 [Cercophora sp. LCS_1]
MASPKITQPIDDQLGTSNSTVTMSATSTTPSSPPKDQQEQTPQSLIHRSPLPSHQKSVLLALCQVPPGSFTTYGILATHLKSSPRAVGNALRRNPFAPTVPCHRVVATGNTLGGFKGKIGSRDGEGCMTLVEKRMLLKKEGVRFDARGRVLGTPFRGFV